MPAKFVPYQPDMSVSLTVSLVRGIDYGPEDGGDPVAWEWFNATMEQYPRPSGEPRADGCDTSCPNAGGDYDGIPILVVHAAASETYLWSDSGAIGSSTADVLALIEGQSDSKDMYDALLGAYCGKRGLPWKKPRWIVTIDHV